MSCYHPLIGIPTGELTEKGKQKLLIRNAAVSADPLKEAKENNGVIIPCGRCIGCRLDYSRRWADRMMLELETAKKGVFVTLTYDDEHLPVSEYEDTGIWNITDKELIRKKGLVFDGDQWLKPKYGTLKKKDCQDFMKRVRKHWPDIRIRFFLAGEYGDGVNSTKRPHYHVILFGIGLDDLGSLVRFGKNELGQDYFISKEMEERWSNGHVLVTDVSWATCAYVARYVTKKLSGPMSIEYAEKNRIKEFCLMSRKPGIGAEYLKEHPDCLDFLSINISTPEGGRKIQIPKYYIKQLVSEKKEENKLISTDQERYDKIQKERLRFASDSMLLELQRTDQEYLDYLETKEENLKAKFKALKRRV